MVADDDMADVGPVEQRQAVAVWRHQQATFSSKVAGPHFESLCRAWAAEAGQEVFGDLPAEVTPGRSRSRPEPQI